MILAGEFEQVWNPMLPYPKLQVQQQQNPSTLEKQWVVEMKPQTDSQERSKWPENGKSPTIRKTTKMLGINKTGRELDDQRVAVLS